MKIFLSNALTLKDAIRRDNNNFDLVRLLAALAVVFGHSFTLFHQGGYHEPILGHLGEEYSGSLAVYVFFFLSGIFITASFNGSSTFFRFVLMRVFRIFPALIVCLLLTVFVIGPAFTRLPVAQYFSLPTTSQYLYRNVDMFDFQPALPSVFDHNYFHDAINGALWTLPIEVKCYLITLLLGGLTLLKRKGTVCLIFIFFIVFSRNKYLMAILQADTREVIFFIAGMVAFTFKEYLVIDYRIALLMVLACVGLHFGPFKIFLAMVLLTMVYTMLVLATSGMFKKIKLPGDYSYGIYIYGFLIQQIVSHFFPTLTAYPGMLICIPLIIAAGAASWYLIELPAIGLGKRMAKRYELGSVVYKKDYRLKRASAV